MARAEASGGTYDVVFCSSLNRSYGGEIETTNAFTARNLCSDPQNDNAIKIESVARATDGRSARVSWGVEPPLGIVGVSAEGRLRRADGFSSKLFMADAEGRLSEEVADGTREPGDFRTVEWEGIPQRQFVARLECTQAPSCEASDHARTWVRNLRFTVADFSDPEVAVEGSLFGGGWLRGEARVDTRGTDSGSGLFQLTVDINSDPILEEEASCDGRVSIATASDFTPCMSSAFSQEDRSTTQVPFANGTNVVRSCAADFAGNETCLTDEIRVDNELPAARFSVQDPDDPELIRVPVQDDFSGLEGGAIFFRLVDTSEWRPLVTQKLPNELRARVDSAAEVPGTYEFLATATDVAGNASETTLRADGTPMTLEFPLRSGVVLNAHIEPGGAQRTKLAYGKRATAEGRLFDAAGEPLAGKPVTVDEDFGEGALIDHRLRTVITDTAGRWSSKLPAGPSRSVSVTYEGDQRYLDDEEDAGSLAVKTGAKLGLSRRRVPEGSGTTFHGRIERLGARIPSRGKVVQLQYQDPTSGRWSTVRNPFTTRSDGRFSFKYKFGTHYVTDVAIRFRLKVPPERGWPYRGTRTGPERVIVEAR